MVDRERLDQTEVKRRTKMNVSVMRSPMAADEEKRLISLTSLYGEMKPYSRSEREIFNLMPKGGKRISSVSLAEKREDKFGWDVTHARNAVIVIMNSLMRKVYINEEDFHIRQTDRTGPYPLEYWIVPGPGPGPGTGPYPLEYWIVPGPGPAPKNVKTRKRTRR